MNRRLIVGALLSSALGCAPLMRAQSIAPGTGDQKLEALRAQVSHNQSELSALSYLESHPLSAASHAVQILQRKGSAPQAGAKLASGDPRPECPMRVAKPVIDDSMPVSRARAGSPDSMPVARPVCMNPVVKDP